MFKKLYWWIRIVLMALINVPNYHLGDIVIYKDYEWTLIQGVCKPYWNLYSAQVDDTIKDIHESEFRKKRCLTNLWWGFKFHYNWLMTSWFKIWTSHC